MPLDEGVGGGVIVVVTVAVGSAVLDDVRLRESDAVQVRLPLGVAEGVAVGDGVGGGVIVVVPVLVFVVVRLKDIKESECDDVTDFDREGEADIDDDGVDDLDCEVVFVVVRLAVPIVRVRDDVCVCDDVMVDENDDVGEGVGGGVTVNVTVRLREDELERLAEAVKLVVPDDDPVELLDGDDVGDGVGGGVIVVVIVLDLETVREPRLHDAEADRVVDDEFDAVSVPVTVSDHDVDPVAEVELDTVKERLAERVAVELAVCDIVRVAVSVCETEVVAVDVLSTVGVLAVTVVDRVFVCEAVSTFVALIDEEDDGLLRDSVGVCVFDLVGKVEGDLVMVLLSDVVRVVETEGDWLVVEVRESVTVSDHVAKKVADGDGEADRADVPERVATRVFERLLVRVLFVGDKVGDLLAESSFEVVAVTEAVPVTVLVLVVELVRVALRVDENVTT